MTQKYYNVYVNNTSLIAGKIENEGPLNKYFDKVYNDFMANEKSFELAEVKMYKDCLDLLMKKENLKDQDIDLFIGGDLLNQITSTCYAIDKHNIPFLGVYSACAISTESLIVGASLIEANQAKKIVCGTSSHNLTTEKQFRNPVEYGAPKPKLATFTSTGAATILISDKKSDIKIESSTIGKIIDMGQTDANNMGAVMAPAAADTINKHLQDLKRDVDYYDLILTGDLGLFGKEILKDYMMQEYKINLGKNYNDCGVMLYDIKKQKEITAGGSGPVCSALVNYGYVYNMLKEKKLKRVLLVATGALFSPTFVYQKQPILAIAHAVSLEVI